MTVRWCDPPRIGRRPVWFELLSPLLAHPDRWALVREYDNAPGAWQAAKGLRQAAAGRKEGSVPLGRWEFRSGQIESNVPCWGVWARYRGPA